MKYYNRSIDELIIILRKNPNITRNEWDEYANLNNFYSAITLITHNNVNDWEGLKSKFLSKKIKFNYKDIKKVRKKLNESVRTNGIQSDETRKLSDEMDILINHYYRSIQIVEIKDSVLINGYYKSYSYLKEYVKDITEFPTKTQWSKYATKHGCLNTESMRYISMLDWRHLEKRIRMEINFEKNFK